MHLNVYGYEILYWYFIFSLFLSDSSAAFQNKRKILLRIVPEMGEELILPFVCNET